MKTRTKVNLLLILSIFIPPIIGNTFAYFTEIGSAGVSPPLIIALVASIAAALFIVINKKLNLVSECVNTKNEELIEKAKGNVEFIEKYFLWIFIIYNILGTIIPSLGRTGTVNDKMAVLLSTLPQLCFVSIPLIFGLNYVLESNTSFLGISKKTPIRMRSKFFTLSVILPLGASLVITLLGFTQNAKIEEARVNAESRKSAFLSSVIADMDNGTSNTIIKEKIRASMETTEDSNTFDKFNQKLLAGNIIVLVFILIIYLIVLKVLYKPIWNIIVAFRELSNRGDNLTSKLEITSKDEIGELVYYFNIFIEKVGAVIDDIKVISDKVGYVSENILNISDSTNLNMGQVKDETNELNKSIELNVASSEELLATIHDIASAAVQLTQKSNDLLETSNLTKKDAEEGKNTLDTAISTMKEINSSVKDSEANIQEFSRQSQQITSIVDSISNIAEQTNLLSLNAAIEAARAGESGRGFAVVADEIRKLSENSATSIKMIKSIVDEIKKSIEIVVLQMENNNVEVEKGITTVMSAGQLLGGIIQSFMDINQKIKSFHEVVLNETNAIDSLELSVRSVAVATEQQSQKSININKVIQEEDTITKNLSDASDKLRNITGELKNAAGKISTE